jgi:hypothetical protein
VWYFLPSGWSLPFLILGTAWTAMLGSCSGAMTIAEVAKGKPLWPSFVDLFAILGFGVIPVTATLFFVGALLAGRWPARATLWVATLSATIAGLALMMVHAVYDPRAWTLVLVMYVPPIAVVTVAVLVSTALGVRDVRRGIAEGRKHRFQTLLRVRGEASFDTIASEVGISAMSLVDFVRDLSQKREVDVVVDEQQRMVFSPARYAHKEWDLVSVAYGRGSVSLSDLSRELKVGEERLKALLVSAMQRGLFAGYVDWKQKRVYSADAARLRGQRQCPNCGGAMDLAGRGLIVCPFCAAEVFLA